MKEFYRAVRELGAGSVSFQLLDYPDGRMNERHRDRLVEELADIARDMTAAVLWASWESDPHCDHQIVAQAAWSASVRCAIPLWEYAVWGRFGSRAVPPVARLRRFYDDTAQKRKHAAAACYQSQTTDLIDDDPTGFRMPENLLRHFVETDEIFVQSVHDD